MTRSLVRRKSSRRQTSPQRCAEISADVSDERSNMSWVCFDKCRKVARLQCLQGEDVPFAGCSCAAFRLFVLEGPNMKKKRAQSLAPRCPYCGSHSVLRSADGIYRNNDKNAMLYVCSRYPACDSYVRVHPGTKIPVGTMANRELRALRNEAHRNFDQLHKKGLMSKEDAYHWLASILAAPLGQAHIGYLGEYYCRQVIEESKKVLDLQKNKRQIRTA